MDKNSKLELENSREYHFVILGYNEFKDIYASLTSNLNFYRFQNKGKVETKEVIYDVPDNTLTDSGIVISILEENNKHTLKVRKISRLQGNLKRPPKTYVLGRVEKGEEPKDYSLQVSSAIDDAFTINFTTDIDDFVKKTVAKIEVDIEGTRYNIICGSGYRASILFENATYKDLKTGKKVSRAGVTLLLPREPRPESEELLKVIDRKVCELALYNYSRFEIASQLLYPKVSEVEGQTETDEDSSEE